MPSVQRHHGEGPNGFRRVKPYEAERQVSRLPPPRPLRGDHVAGSTVPSATSRVKRDDSARVHHGRGQHTAPARSSGSHRASHKSSGVVTPARLRTVQGAYFGRDRRGLAQPVAPVVTPYSRRQDLIAILNSFEDSMQEDDDLVPSLAPEIGFNQTDLALSVDDKVEKPFCTSRFLPLCRAMVRRMIRDGNASAKLVEQELLRDTYVLDKLGIDSFRAYVEEARLQGVSIAFTLNNKGGIERLFFCLTEELLADAAQGRESKGPALTPFSYPLLGAISETMGDKTYADACDVEDELSRKDRYIFHRWQLSSLLDYAEKAKADKAPIDFTTDGDRVEKLWFCPTVGMLVGDLIPATEGLGTEQSHKIEWKLEVKTEPICEAETTISSVDRPHLDHPAVTRCEETPEPEDRVEEASLTAISEGERFLDNLSREIATIKAEHSRVKEEWPAAEPEYQVAYETAELETSLPSIIEQELDWTRQPPRPTIIRREETPEEEEMTENATVEDKSWHRSPKKDALSSPGRPTSKEAASVYVKAELDQGNLLPPHHLLPETDNPHEDGSADFALPSDGKDKMAIVKLEGLVKIEPKWELEEIETLGSSSLDTFNSSVLSPDQQDLYILAEFLISHFGSSPLGSLSAHRVSRHLSMRLSRLRSLVEEWNDARYKGLLNMTWVLEEGRPAIVIKAWVLRVTMLTADPADMQVQSPAGFPPVSGS